MNLIVPLNTTKSLTVWAAEEFSQNVLVIEEKQQYRLLCNDQQTWIDWFVKTSPDGYFNLPAWVYGLRVKHTKCFCLCGAYNNNLETGFGIGKHCDLTATESGFISFFANDSPGFYRNNKGSIAISITRLK